MSAKKSDRGELTELWRALQIEENYRTAVSFTELAHNCCLWNLIMEEHNSALMKAMKTVAHRNGDSILFASRGLLAGIHLFPHQSSQARACIFLMTTLRFRAWEGSTVVRVLAPRA